MPLWYCAKKPTCQSLTITFAHFGRNAGLGRGVGEVEGQGLRRDLLQRPLAARRG